jgi:hypothetical protein
MWQLNIHRDQYVSSRTTDLEGGRIELPIASKRIGRSTQCQPDRTGRIVGK